MGNEEKPGRTPLTNNWLSMFGFVLGIVFIAGEVLLIGIDLFHGSTGPYIGILIYLIGPAILAVGLLLVPTGMWLEHRRRLRNLPRRVLPIINLNVPSHRQKIGIFLGVTVVFVLLSLVGTYRAYHLTESTAFCGTTCHQVMHPEYVAYQYSPHANVGCTGCHIGEKADWYVKSKISGARQVVKTLAGTYELPIDTPIHNLVPARYTCEKCHWPGQFNESVEKRRVHYGSDDENTPYAISLLLHVGEHSGPKGSGSIHWHIGLDHTLEYYAVDEDRQEIPWIRVTHEDGSTVEYLDEGAPDFDRATMDESRIQVMDCVDCHDRPSHRFKSPSLAVDEALRFGRVDPTVPAIKANLVSTLAAEYESTPAALEQIEERLRSTYADALADGSTPMGQRVEQAIGVARQIYEQNSFPEWGVDWSTHGDEIGHFRFPGCYRCHDGEHRSTDGQREISFECGLCHTIVQQGEGWDNWRNLEYSAQEFVHPRGMGDVWQFQNCHECHGPGLM